MNRISVTEESINQYLEDYRPLFNQREYPVTAHLMNEVRLIHKTLHRNFGDDRWKNAKIDVSISEEDLAKIAQEMRTIPIGFNEEVRLWGSLITFKIKR